MKDADSRTVSLAVPSDPDFLLLARLALGAVCRLTTLRSDEVIDLKLAVTEAAAGVLDEGERPPTFPDRIGFVFRLSSRIASSSRSGAHCLRRYRSRSGASDPCGRAILEATVDGSEDLGGAVRPSRSYSGRSSPRGRHSRWRLHPHGIGFSRPGRHARSAPII